MRAAPSIRTVSYRRPGRLVPRREHGLRAGSVVLRPGRVMDWHSTDRREELLIVLVGRVRVEIATPSRRKTVRLKAGQCALLPRRTRHRVVNRSATNASYLYITALVR